MKDFFVSFSSADKAWAEWIAWQLLEAGYSVELQGWTWGPGANFPLEMDRVAERLKTDVILTTDHRRFRAVRPDHCDTFRLPIEER